MNDTEGLLRALQKEEQWSNTYLRAELSQSQIDALKRFYGDEYGDEVEGRSRVTTREVYEIIQWLRPDLKRVFTAGDRVCEYEGVTAEGDQYADEVSDYINYIFMVDNPGERVLDEFIFDGLLQRRGVIAAEWEEGEFSPAQEVSGLNTEQAAQLLQQAQTGQLQIEGQDVEEGPPDEAHPDGLYYSFSIRKLTKDGKPAVFTVAPEDFRIAARSVDLETTRYCGDIVRMMRGEAKRKWPEHEEAINSYSGATSTFSVDDRRAERFRDIEGWDSSQIAGGDDGEASEVEILREYIRFDLNEDGYPELIRCYRLGDTLLEHDEVDEHIYSSWTPIPIPHRFYGLSVADEAGDLQRTKTVLLRGMLDSVYLSVVPRVVAQTGVNLDDLLVVQPGAVIRSEANGPGGGVTPLVTPDLSGGALAAMQWMDRVLESRTGVTRQAQGFDPDLLHDTAKGVELLQNAASVRKEEIARNLADGLQSFFAKLYRLVHKHQNTARAVKIAGTWSHVDPRAWEAKMRCTVDVGLGTGAREKQIVMLQMLQNDQGLAVQQFGPSNPSVTPMELYEMVREKARIMGYKSIDRWFKPPKVKNPQTGQEEPWVPQPQPDPEAAKLQMQAQIEMQKLQANAQTESMKIKAQERQTVLQAQKDMEVATAQQRDEMMRADMDYRANEQTAQIEAAKLQLEAHRAQLEHEREMERMRIEAAQAAAEMELKARELALKEREIDVKGMEVRQQAAIEGARLEDQREARTQEMRARKEEKKADKPAEPKPNGQDRSGEAIGKGLEALAQAMSRPKVIKRGADGKPEGIE